MLVLCFGFFEYFGIFLMGSVGLGYLKVKGLGEEGA